MATSVPLYLHALVALQLRYNQQYLLLRTYVKAKPVQIGRREEIQSSPGKELRTLIVTV
jgi:hypothetical protein